MRVRLLLGFSYMLACCCFAQTNQIHTNSRSVKLEECIDLALANNLDIQIQRLNTDLGAYSLTASYGAYDPVFSLFARRDYLAQPATVDFKKPGGDQPYQLTTDTAGPEIKGALPIGLTYDFNALVGEWNSLTDFRGITNQALMFPPDGIRRTNQFFANAAVTATQHLLRDSWIDQNRRLILLRRKDLKISEQAMTFQVMQTMLAVELAYYDVIAARELVAVQAKALELTRQFVAETRRRVEVGDAPPLDMDQAESQFESTQSALTIAREQLVNRENALKSLLSSDFRSWVDVNLQPADPLIATEEHLDRAESFKAALKNRPDLIQARLAIERSDVDIRFYKNQLFPSLDAFGSYGGLGVNESGRSAASDALHFRDKEYSYGVILTLPLTSIRERSDYRASQGRKKIAQLQLQRAEQQIFLQIADYVNGVESRFSQVGSTRRARVYAESALAAEQKKLENGISTSFVVLELQEKLTAARTAEVQALADYNRMVAQLAFAEGRTLERHRMDIEWR
jgi:outer membrane protein